MRRIQKILLAVLALFIAIQFIQPSPNKSDDLLSTDFIKVIYVPDSVQYILQAACFDCHSNNTNYPWYSNIQPMAWLMANHIKKGKEVLNFSEFGIYKPRKQLSKLTGMVNSIKDGNMPLTSYSWMHKDARLTTIEKTLLISWMTRTLDSLSTNN